MMQEPTLGFAEKVIFALRALYDRYGYTQYRMSKFEEYDLYARNKDFLISDGVITFTDTNGRLMALKPDVTLSIVKNTNDAPAVQKLYYNENVYRVSKGVRAFREIMQVGLECLGDIDDYIIYEVLVLAAKSLRTISENCILDVSDLSLLSELIDRIGVPAASKSAILKCIGEKNMHELTAICRENAVADDDIEILKKLISMSGPAAEILPQVIELLSGKVDENELKRFAAVINAAAAADIAPMMHIDFSVVDDVHYYNGIVFKGFVASVPASVLSGGQYDKLMQKMNRSSGAIGFAVYMDALERLDMPKKEFDVDIAVLYDEATPIAVVQKWVKAFMDSGSSVLVQRSLPEGLKCRQLMKITNGEVEFIENNA